MDLSRLSLCKKRSSDFVQSKHSKECDGKELQCASGCRTREVRAEISEVGNLSFKNVEREQTESFSLNLAESSSCNETFVVPLVLRENRITHEESCENRKRLPTSSKISELAVGY